jgi:hypothetical protein
MNNGADASARDSWSKTQIVLTAVSSVLLPLVVAAVGGFYTYLQNKHHDADLAVQKDHEKVTARAQQATQLLVHLASLNDRERLLAIKVAEQLGKDDLLPQELVPVLVETASSDPNATVSSAAQQAVAATKQVTTVAPGGSVATQAFQPASVLQSLPPRVYVHIRSDNQHSAALTLSSALELAGYNVPGIQKVEIGPTRSELRYFGGSDPNDIAGIGMVLADQHLIVVPTDLSARYKNAGLRSRHYELWLAPDYLPKPPEGRPGQR